MPTPENLTGNIADLQRLMHNLVRVGTIHAVDLAATPASVRVLLPLKAKAGAIRRDMFARMRRPATLRKSRSKNSAAVLIVSAAASTARVHKYGLRDKVDWPWSRVRR